jgi:hypothetical protein
MRSPLGRALGVAGNEQIALRVQSFVESNEWYRKVEEPLCHTRTRVWIRLEYD